MQTHPNLTTEQRAALEAFARAHEARPEGWKQHLCDLWLCGTDANEPGGNYLRQIRNTFGPSWLMDVYGAYWRPDCPAWERIVVDDRGMPTESRGLARWGNYDDPPAPGATVVSTISGLGEGVVTGYFVEHTFLGLIVRLSDDRPEWHVEQKKGDPVVHLFGPEIMSADEKKLSAWGLRLIPLASFQRGHFVIRAFTGAPSMTAEEINDRHRSIKRALQCRVAETLSTQPHLGEGDPWVVYDPHADGDGWLLVGPRAEMVAESLDFHQSMHG